MMNRPRSTLGPRRLWSALSSPAATSRAARRLIARGALAALAVAACSPGLRASEGGASLFVPGLTVPGGGLLPPPGVYFDNTVFLYQGKLTGQRQIALGGNVVAGVKANLWADFATWLWVTPAEVLGGRLALAVSVPFGEPTVRAGAVISGPLLNRLIGRPLGFRVEDATLNFGDPVATATLGWSASHWHWKLAAAASIPAGAYQPGELSNVALNRWIGDVSLGVTYLDPTLGLDISAVGGFTVNGENPDTDYRTGNELHLDVGITKNLTKAFKVGVIGSHYRQITGDSGEGARLGPYKGRVTAVGGVVGYTFTVGHTPVATQFKVLHEVDVENRPQGTIGWVQVSFPLWVAPGAAREAVPQPIRARF